MIPTNQKPFQSLIIPLPAWYNGHIAPEEREVITMIVENSEPARAVRAVAASLAMENMYISEDYIKKLLLVTSGEMDVEELIQEVKQEYAR